MGILEAVTATQMGMVGMVAQLMALAVGILTGEALAAPAVTKCPILGLD